MAITGLRRLLDLTTLLFSLALISSGEPFGSIRNLGPFNSDAIEEHDLLQAIRVPFEDPKKQYFESGSDGFPAYGLKEGADIKSHYRWFLPERLYRDFAILATVKLEKRETAYLFAVVNPLDTLIQFGIKISPSVTSSQHVISLLYTDVASHLVTQTLVSFEVPTLTRKWTKFAIKVVGDDITLYLNCQKHSTEKAYRNPKELVFDTASTLYIGQAGPLLKGYFQHNFPSGDGSGSFDISGFYDYPSYDDEDGSGAPPLPPMPPPTPSSSDTSPFGNLAGFKGQKGEKGEPGPKGESIRGPPGPPGLPSPPATSVPRTVESGSGDEFAPFDTGGQCTCNYTEILTMLPESFRGLPGIDGQEGPTGPQGLPGMPGPEGKQGIEGEKGDRGDLGSPGPEGLPGPKGEAGVSGPPGLPGLPGPPGPAGAPNLIGFDEQMGGSQVMSRPGMPGPKGDKGETGLVGQKGEKGFQGDKGERGFKGIKGDKGERGHQGSKGDIGSPGMEGPPGIDGSPGVAGKDGKGGPKGDRGDSGPPGPPGSAVSENLINSITTLKGEVGESGPQGPTGERGLPGVPGKPGEKGERGPPGPSGVVDAEGSVTLLKGDKGDQGKRGKRGKPGPPGTPGPAGPSGEMGVPGWPGRPGAPGLSLQGPKGEKGEPAVLPDNFFNYEVAGLRGQPGPPGPPGPPGAPGSTAADDYETRRGSSFVPVPGPPGPKGDMGHPGPPGLSIVGEQGEIGPIGPAGPPGYGQTGPPGPPGKPGEPSKIVPGAVVFLTREAMLKTSELSPVGALGFVKDEERLFARVSEGWKPIIMGELIRSPPSMQHSELTTEPTNILRPPFEASNLVNRVQGPSLRMAALNDPWSGDMHGVRGADYSCYRQARSANLAGTFRGFLSSFVQNLDSIVKYSDRNLPVLNTKGELLFNSWSEIFQSNGRFVSRPPHIYSFNGRNVMEDFHWPQKMAWHGSDPVGVREKSSYCEAWHSGSSSNVGLATDLLKGQVLGQENVGCNNKLIVLCVEIASQDHRRRRRRNAPKLRDTEDLLNYGDYVQFLDEFDRELENFETNSNFTLQGGAY